jgi:hypothetical protein
MAVTAVDVPLTRTVGAVWHSHRVDLHAEDLIAARRCGNRVHDGPELRIAEPDRPDIDVLRGVGIDLTGDGRKLAPLPEPTARL